MDAFIILDTTKNPNEIITVQQRSGLIRILDSPSNCFVTVQYLEGQPDTLVSIAPPSLAGHSIDVSDASKGYLHYDANVLKAILQAEGTDVSLVDAYIANTDLSVYANPKRGYLIYDSLLLKPFLIANGVAIERLEDFEKENSGNL